MTSWLTPDLVVSQGKKIIDESFADPNFDPNDGPEYGKALGVIDLVIRLTGCDLDQYHTDAYIAWEDANEESS